MIFLLLCVLLCSCTSKGAAQEVEEVSADAAVTEAAPAAEETEEAAVEEAAEEAPVSRNMALLEIRTERTDEHALDFATEPVTGFVGEAIGLWNAGYEEKPEPFYEDCLISLTDTEGRMSVCDAKAAVKVRGNWTTCYPKKPFRIKFDEKQSMLGLNGGAKEKNWVLLAEYKDASMLRNKTGFYLGRELLYEDGLYSSDSEFVEVTINGEYWGVYLLAERQEADRYRIDVEDPGKGYEGTDIGYILEMDGYYVYEDELNRFVPSYAGNAALTSFDGRSGGSVTPLRRPGESSKKDIGMSVKSDIYSEDQKEFIKNYINKVYYIMYAAAYQKRSYEFNEDYTDVVRNTELSLREAVEQAVDLYSLVDMYILSELTCDQDIYWSSFFMDVDFGEYGDRRLHFEAPWDFDSSMGNTMDVDGLYAAAAIHDDNNGYNAVNPWLNVMMKADWFDEMVREEWIRLYDSGFIDRALEMIKNDTGRYADEFERNYDKWDNILDEGVVGELSEGSKACTTQAEAAQYLYDWLAQRAEFMDSYWREER